jgi:large subunit ribosomal protein L18
MNRLTAKRNAHVARKRRVNKAVRKGNTRPRLTVYKSLKHIYAQIIDDDSGRTLVEASSLGRDLRDQLKKSSDVEAAKAVGAALGRKAVAREITKVAFDRNGYAYHGKVKALADAARAAGLEF